MLVLLVVLLVMAVLVVTIVVVRVRGVPLSVPNVRPRQQDSHLDGQEYKARYDDAEQIDTQSVEIVVLLPDSAVGCRRRRRFHVWRRLLRAEPEFVGNLNALHQQHVVADVLGAGGPPPTLALTERMHGPELAGRVLLVALHRFAGGHARCY